jgi:ring-1,2-phenylacetyl-CoA epoxidase subunit PaaD
MEMITPEKIWQTLEEVKDPEIPVVSVVELGIVRSVAVSVDKVVVTITPTFAGCPALHVMEREIQHTIRRLGVEVVEVDMALNPAWTSDWITTAGRTKMKTLGLSPPPRHGGNFEIALLEPAACPRCDSQHTTLKNSFGPTLCRALYTCNNCQETFEQFKPL